jgi:hypothetical protein
MNFWSAFEMLWAPPWTDASHFLDLVGNAAPLIAFCAYLVKDIIWLRAFTIISAATWLLYLFSGAHILWLAAFWNAAFIVVGRGGRSSDISVIIENRQASIPLFEILLPRSPSRRRL